MRILGDLEVLRDGAPLDLGSPRQRAVLARLLISSNESVTADRLVEDLWPGDVPDSARNALHVYLSKLRAALGPDRERLVRHGSGYCFEIESDALDATRFVGLVAEGRAAMDRGDPDGADARLSEALGLWRGPVLADIADEDFVRTEAARLEEIRLVALEHHGDAALALGRHDEMVEKLRALISNHPFRERFWEQLMLALYRSKRQAEALRVYQEARTHLVEELGIEPGPALRQLEDRILTQDPTLDLVHSTGAGRSNMPRLRTSFVGRERELRLGAELLAAFRLLTLTGPPGSGKTRLAIQLATENAGSFPHGSYFVPLAAVTDTRLVGTTIAKALGLRDVPGEEPVESLGAYLDQRRALLVLDNFEHILGAVPLIDQLLDAAPDIKIMVSSRSPLGIAGEQEFPVAPLSVPVGRPDRGLADIQDYDAVALFVSRAQAADPSFVIDGDNAADIAAITRHMDGLPLAIELAAARTRLLPPRDMLARLEHHLPVLAEGPTDATGRHRTLTDAIAWSYALLEPGEQDLYRHLGVFRGFTLDAAADVAGLPDATVLGGIDSLLSRSLVYRSDGGGEARYTMLETLRDFALEKLDSMGERDEVMLRHAEYFCRMAEDAELGLTRDTQHATIQALSQELGNLRGALQYAVDHDNPDLGLVLAGCTWRFWQSTGRLTEGRHWLNDLLASTSASDAARAKGLNGLAGLAYWQGDWSDSISRYEEALVCYRAIGDRLGEADTLFGLSMAITWSGDLETGDQLAAEARATFESLGDREKIGQIYMAQAFLLHRRGDHGAARPLWEAALGVSRELGDHQLAATELIGLGICEYHEGRLGEALRIALDALDQAIDLENIQVAVWLLDFVAAFAAETSPAEAVRLSSAADATRIGAGGGMELEPLDIIDARTVASRVLSSDDVIRAWTEGRTMSMEQAVDEARRLRRVDAGDSSHHIAR